METLRILSETYPNPKRTVLVGLWNSEEQGLNGSRAFVADHPEIVDNIQATKWMKLVSNAGVLECRV